MCVLTSCNSLPYQDNKHDLALSFEFQKGTGTFERDERQGFEIFAMQPFSQHDSIECNLVCGFVISTTQGLLTNPNLEKAAAGVCHPASPTTHMSSCFS